MSKLRDAAQKVLDDLEDAAEEWSRYVVEDTAHCTLLKHLEPHINALRAALAEQPAEQQPQEPVAWGIFYFGGKRNGRLYSQIDTEEGAKRYISDLHRSNDTDTFRAAPLYTAPKPRRNVTYVCPVCAASLERQE